MICFADPLPIQVEEMPEDISDAAADVVAALLLELVELTAGDGEGGEC